MRNWNASSRRFWTSWTSSRGHPPLSHQIRSDRPPPPHVHWIIIEREEGSDAIKASKDMCLLKTLKRIWGVNATLDRTFSELCHTVSHISNHHRLHVHIPYIASCSHHDSAAEKKIIIEQHRQQHFCNATKNLSYVVEVYKHTQSALVHAAVFNQNLQTSIFYLSIGSFQKIEQEKQNKIEFTVSYMELEWIFNRLDKDKNYVRNISTLIRFWIDGKLYMFSWFRIIYLIIITINIIGHKFRLFG